MYAACQKRWLMFYRSLLLRRSAIWIFQIAIFYCSLRAAALVRFDFQVPSNDLKAI